MSGGDKIPRKGGPGVTQSDLLVINKTDLAEAVGASLDVMRTDAMRYISQSFKMCNESNCYFRMRGAGPIVFAQAKHKIGVPEICTHILEALESAVPGKKV